MTARFSSYLALFIACSAASPLAQEHLGDVLRHRDTATQAAAQASARSLTLAQANELALGHNLDLAVERVNGSVVDLELAGIQASYLPLVSGLIGALRTTAVPSTLLAGGTSVVTTTSSINGVLTQNVPWGGGAARVVWNNNRVGTNNLFATFNPAYNSNFTAQYTQPLMRGFRTDAVREQLVVTRRSRTISELQLTATVANTLSSVGNAYWDLVFAVDSIDAANKSVALAHSLVEDNQRRVEAGTMTRLDLVSSRAQEATARHQLVVAEGQRRTMEVALKRLLVAGPDDLLWQQTLVPVDRPAVVDQAIDVDAAVRRGLAGRTDLAQAREQVAANQATYNYLRDQARPQADVVATYAPAGLGGTLLVRPPVTGNIFSSPVIATIPGGFDDALKTLVTNDFPTWGIAVNVTYPIGFSAQRADAARAKVQIEQVETEVRRIEVSVVSDITNAAVAVRNNIDDVQTAVVARDLAEQRLDAEQKRFAAGISTNFQVVQAQKDLSDARNAELQAEVSYRKSLVDFDRVQQTTLQSAGVIVVGPSTPSLPVGSGHLPVPAPSGTVF